MKSSKLIGIRTSPDKIFVIIPAKDEERYISKLLENLIELGFTNLVVVNDSSTDQTALLADLYPEVTVLSHSVNLGAGAATQTGISYAVSKKADLIATIDGDLQHVPDNLLNLINILEQSQSDLVIGSRFLGINDIPQSRVIFNKIGNFISLLLTGIYLTDSQSGMKVISRNLSRSINLNYDGYEFCIELIKQAKSLGFKIMECPIEVIYTPETKNKGQNFLSGVRMVARMFAPFS